MKLGLPSLLSAAAALVTLLSPPSALAACKGGAPDGKCEPGPDEDCACKDCSAACEGGCTASNPPACTLEDACTCPECWADEVCTDPDRSNCKDDADCDFFQEGCCCADCAGLSQCAGFDGSCGGEGAGGAGGAGGSGGAGGAGGSGGSGGSGASGGSGGSGGGTAPGDGGGCGCSAAGRRKRRRAS
jgi:hypothetical protein